MNQRVSDIITIEDIKSWNTGDLISITSGTGTGKSYFVRNLLYAIAMAEGKKILYLVNRKRLLQQIKQELVSDKKTDIIDVFTYQKIQAHVLHENTTHFKDIYKYIVCDEYHYFITDASFNHTTDLSLDTIIAANDRIRIFMSATSNFMLDYLERHKNLKVNKYEIDYQYNHIKKIFFYENDATVKKFLFELNQNEKVIYFCHSAERAYKLSKEFVDSLFVCGDSNKEYKRYLKTEEIQKMLEDERFEQQFLFTTHTLDNGINIIDEDVKYIIVDIEDFDILIQCIGRKRTQGKDDNITILIKKMNHKSIGGRITQLNKKLKMTDFLIAGNTTEDFIKKYPRQYSGDMIYDSFENESIIKTVNEVMYCKCTYDIDTFNEILKEENGYEKKILGLLKKEKYELLEHHYDSLTLNDYLNALVGKKMFKDEQKQFKDFIKQNIINIPKSSHGSLGYNTISGYFRDNDLQFLIKSEEEKERGKNRGKRYWIIGKITY
ncbi:hypothetical protein C8Z91_02190 [Paenibacillus elgii]|uniref:Helicase ATP-binding domain-containing protein n=1 Tax=Paenibacillus elgii TaxID=189691 RepID=A0A2T6G944_9BACL|nr:DEAD/DEAH box helicase family protein [Paenibacillus elgii]PUA40660.1 hypothetical protein C8Z91_02190 [Paenibacillus elgii]